MIDTKEERLCIVSLDDFGIEVYSWSDEEFLKNATSRGWVYSSLESYHRSALAPRGEGYVLRLVTLSRTIGTGR